MEAEGSGAHGSLVLMKHGRQVPAPPSDQFSQIDKFNLTGNCLKVKVDNTWGRIPEVDLWPSHTHELT